MSVCFLLTWAVLGYQRLWSRLQQFRQNIRLRMFAKAAIMQFFLCPTVKIAFYKHTAHCSSYFLHTLHSFQHTHTHTHRQTLEKLNSSKCMLHMILCVYTKNLHINAQYMHNKYCAFFDLLQNDSLNIMQKTTCWNRNGIRTLPLISDWRMCVPPMCMFNMITFNKWLSCVWSHLHWKQEIWEIEQGVCE